MHSNNWQLDISIAETLECLETEKNKLDPTDNFILHGTIQVSFILRVNVKFIIQTRTLLRVNEAVLNITPR